MMSQIGSLSSEIQMTIPCEYFVEAVGCTDIAGARSVPLFGDGLIVQSILSSFTFQRPFHQLHHIVRYFRRCKPVFRLESLSSRFRVLSH